MSSFFVIYKSEIKKIISKKAVWLAMTIGLILVLLMGFTNLSSEGHISYVSSSREILSQMDGMDIDEAFFLNFQNEVFEELKLNPEKYEKLMDYDPGAAFMNGAGAVGKKSVFDFIYNVVRERSMVETVTAEEFYEKMRDNIISDGQELGSNDEEINEWLKEYDSIEKPIKYYYAQSYANILDVWFFVGWVLFFNIAIALAGVFADEKTFRTDAILLSTKRGRIALCVSKVLAGITVALIEALILVGGLFTVMFVFFGKGGAQGMIQNMIPSSPWNITIGRMTGLYVLLAIVTTIMFALTNMLVSYLTHSAVATMAGHAAVLFVGLFNVPSKLGILAKLWQLRPTMALHYGTFCNTYRYGKMNNVEAALLIYGVCIAISVAILILSYRKSQIESR